MDAKKVIGVIGRLALRAAKSVWRSLAEAVGNIFGLCLLAVVFGGPFVLAKWVQGIGIVRFVGAVTLGIAATTILLAVFVTLRLHLKGAPAKHILESVRNVLYGWGLVVGLLLLTFMPGLLILGAVAVWAIVLPFALFVWIKERRDERAYARRASP